MDDPASYRVSDHAACHNWYPSTLVSFASFQAQECRVAQFNVGHMQFYVFDFNFCCSGCVSAASHQVECRFSSLQSQKQFYTVRQQFFLGEQGYHKLVKQYQVMVGISAIQVIKKPVGPSGQSVAWIVQAFTTTVL